VISVLACVENEFDALGDAEFLEDPGELFFHGWLAEREFRSDHS